MVARRLRWLRRFLYYLPLTDSTDSTDNEFRIKMVARRLRWLRRFLYLCLILSIILNFEFILVYYYY